MQRVKLGNSHFNSRPHGGRQWMELCQGIRENISTHALTEGDADREDLFQHRAVISTHALTEGDFFFLSPAVQ